ncbi:MAG: 50S ribosomal protein L23 [Desulfobacteraceae bacterium]|nr:50S ribosomal protein L23 [Desulfobacteraceae bacterium]MDA8417909.1 50S ribosomal protein L23 [Desulfobacteraceae bacterium]
MKRDCDIIKKPCLTEKGLLLQEKENQVVLRVDPKANKIEIKEAAEKYFNLKVTKVRTANMPGKSKRVGKHSGTTSDWKKAIVSLQEGQKLDFLEQL